MACAGEPTPLQSISDARSAVYAASIKLPPCPCTDTQEDCPCEALYNAQAAIKHAETLMRNGNNAAAAQAAQQALQTAQNILYHIHEQAQH